jgi:hypothetical protein
MESGDTALAPASDCGLIVRGEAEPAGAFLLRVVEEFGGLDRIEALMKKHPVQLPVPTMHLFTPGMYVREVFMPAGTLVTSMIHKTEHPFVIAKGAVWVWTAEDGVQRFQAGHLGVTKPGTRRLVFMEEPTIWATFHATNVTDVAELEATLAHAPEPVEISNQG